MDPHSVTVQGWGSRVDLATGGRVGIEPLFPTLQALLKGLKALVLVLERASACVCILPSACSCA